MENLIELNDETSAAKEKSEEELKLQVETFENKMTEMNEEDVRKVCAFETFVNCFIKRKQFKQRWKTVHFEILKR